MDKIWKRKKFFLINHLLTKEEGGWQGLRGWGEAREKQRRERASETTLGRAHQCPGHHDWILMMIKFWWWSDFDGDHDDDNPDDYDHQVRRAKGSKPPSPILILMMIMTILILVVSWSDPRAFMTLCIILLCSHSHTPIDENHAEIAGSCWRWHSQTRFTFAFSSSFNYWTLLVKLGPHLWSLKLAPCVCESLFVSSMKLEKNLLKKWTKYSEQPDCY